MWADIRRDYADTYDFHEFTAQYDEIGPANMGIGLAIRRQASASTRA